LILNLEYPDSVSIYSGNRSHYCNIGTIQ
jgi:hypothetical protein